MCEKCVKEGKPINRFTLIPEYIKGTRGVMTKELIMKAFERTGLYPVNRKVFQPEDFAPSKASSSVAHVPDSFPEDVPSSDPIEPSDGDYEPSNNNNSSSDEEMDLENRSGPSWDLEPFKLYDDETESLPVASDDEAKDSSSNEFTTPIPEDPQDPEITIDDSDGMVAAQNTDNAPLANMSGLMASIASIETSVIHMTRSASARLDLFVTALPKTVSLEEDSRLSHENLLNELCLVRQRLSCTYETLGRALGQLSAANAHCTAIHRELGDVRLQLENATKKKERGSKKIKARFLTGANLRAEFERQDAERREQEHVAAEKGRQKEAETAERAQRVADDALNRDFSGRLTSYKKDDLRALAIALSISDKGTNGELVSRIEDCFKTNPNLKNNSRFSGLFSKQLGRKVVSAQEDTLDKFAGEGLTPIPPLPQPYTNPYSCNPSQLHPQNTYPYNVSQMAPPSQPITFPNPSTPGGHASDFLPHPFQYYIPPWQSHGGYLNPQHSS